MNTATMIDPSTILPPRSTLFSSLLSATTSTGEEVTPRRPRRRSDWDDSDSYISFQDPSRQAPGSSRPTQEPQTGNKTPTIIIHTEDPPQENPLSQEEIEAYKALLSEPARPNDHIHQYIRKEARKRLT